MQTSASGDGLSVLAVIVATALSAEQVRDRTGLPSDRVESALAYLRREHFARNVGGGRFRSCQLDCAGCSRSGRTTREQSVQIDPKTFRWFCNACWDAR